MDEQQRIGANIRRLRKAQGFRQVEVAAAGGISRSHLSKVEKGEDGLSVERLFAIAEFLGASINDLESLPSTGRQQAAVGGHEPASSVGFLGIYALLDAEDRDLVVTYMVRLARAAERKKAHAKRPADRGPSLPHQSRRS